MVMLAKTQLHPLIAERWSPRSYIPQSLTQDAMTTILEAGRWAASSRNAQPWRFIIALRDDAENFNHMLGFLKELNQVWARQAGAFILVTAHKYIPGTDRLNRTAEYDTGLAVQNMVLQAMSMGIYTRQMGGIHRDEIREAYRIPAEVEILAVLAMGYPGEPEDLPSETLREKELATRTRQPLSDFVYVGEWEQAASES